MAQGVGLKAEVKAETEIKAEGENQGSGANAENIRQRTEDRGQKTEDGRQRAEVNLSLTESTEDTEKGFSIKKCFLSDLCELE